MQSPFAPGERVGARAQRWQVAHAREARSCVAISLLPSDSSQVASRTLIHPFDRLTRLRRHARLRPARLAHAHRFLDRMLAAPVATWATPTAVAGTSIDLLPHQFVAALALVRGLASRVCVLDTVGTGKTMHAGIAIAELLARGMATRVLVVVPAHLRRQWGAELARLRLESRILDSHGREDAVDALPPDVSPWTLPGTTIASLDLVKRRDTLVGLENIRWDLVVVDEAHGATSHTDRHDAVDAIARRADRVILLTATPHDGDEARYRRLFSLGGTDPVVVVCHSRRQAPRRVHTLAIRPSTDEHAAFAMLGRYRAAIDRLGPLSRSGVNRLVADVLTRRATSSMFALARTAARRQHALQLPDASQPLLFATPWAMLDVDGDDDAAIDALMNAPGALSARHERALLGAIHSAALRASADDSLVRAVTRIVARAGEPVIVFVEYRDALVPIATRLSRMVRVEVLHGDCSASERARALSSFTTGHARVLLATDTASEGLNLHQRCRFVVHLDTPWTPTRLAQRDGRVDRLGQARRVHTWRLERMGYEQAALRARLQERTRAIGHARAHYDDCPVLSTPAGTSPLPSLHREAVQACDVIRHLRNSARAEFTRGRRHDAEVSTPHDRSAPPAREVPAVAVNPVAHPLSTLRPRTRIVAVPRRCFPDSMRDAGAVAVLSVVVSASPAVSTTRQFAIAIGPLREAPTGRPLQAQWRRRLAMLRPWLEEHARAAVDDTVGMLAADEARRQRTLTDRANLVDEALERPLAAHFVQRELFAAAADAQPPLRRGSERARSSYPERSPLVLMDVSLLLVPVHEASEAPVHAGVSPW